MARRGWKEEDKRQTKKKTVINGRSSISLFFLPEISLSSHDSSRGVTRWRIVFFLFIFIFFRLRRPISGGSARAQSFTFDGGTTHGGSDYLSPFRVVLFFSVRAADHFYLTPPKKTKQTNPISDKVWHLGDYLPDSPGSDGKSRKKNTQKKLYQ